MIKVDIINEVAKAADITKVKAEVAVEAVLEAMKDSLMKGERIELRGLRRLPGEAPQARHRPQPPHRQGSADPARAHDPLQARQGPPEPRPLAAAPRGSATLPTGPGRPDLPTAELVPDAAVGLGLAHGSASAGRPGTAGAGTSSSSS